MVAVSIDSILLTKGEFLTATGMRYPVQDSVGD
jgi:hypothetical protein